MAVTIYKLRHSLRNCPTIFATPSHSQFVRDFLFDTNKITKDALIPPFQKADPSLSAQGFYHLSDSVLVFNRHVYMEEMGRLLDFSGNVFPTKITDSGEEVFFLNVTAKYNCLDYEHTLFHAPNGREEIGVDHKMGIKTPAFLPDLIGDSLIFKLPQMSYAIFVASNDYRTDDDFHQLYAESGMNELVFEQAWSNKQSA
jgi:hypothetical protein